MITDPRVPLILTPVLGLRVGLLPKSYPLLAWRDRKNTMGNRLGDICRTEWEIYCELL